MSNEEERYKIERLKMVEEQIRRRGVLDRHVLEAVEKVPRHLFVPEKLRNDSYQDFPLSIGFGQTISQPYIVAYMTEKLRLTKNEKVLEIGVGSGYQTAILAELAKEVYSIEVVPELASATELKLKSMGYTNIRIKQGDGYKGWQEYSPFDAINITAAPEEIPRELVNQLKVGGRMIVPVGSFSQQLYFITKNENAIIQKELFGVRFVPMIHRKENG